MFFAMTNMAMVDLLNDSESVGLGLGVRQGGLRSFVKEVFRLRSRTIG